MEVIEQLFLRNNLGKVNFVKRIDIGFTNEVYSVNNEFIVKIYKNENYYERELFFYEFFKDKIPVPKIKVHDSSFIIYSMIDGDNLYSKWHLLTNKERKYIIKQLCQILRIINSSPYDEFVKKFNVSTFNWHDKIFSKIQKSLLEIQEKKLLSLDFISAIKKFVDEYHHVLNVERCALVYWDAHFDNILVKNNEIVGILDFERTELSSIDYVLDIVNRMVDYPHLYISEKYEKLVKKDDYTLLLKWFLEFYPELFEFENLDKRLIIYAIEYDLKILLSWPNSDEVKQRIAKSIDYISI